MTASETEPPSSGDNTSPVAEAVSADSDRLVSDGSLGASTSDQAAEKDYLGFELYVKAIAQFLTSPRTKPPLTLSIEGEWGSGKSSFMKQLEKAIKQIEIGKSEQKLEPKIVWFNAWRHDKVDSMWAAFALEFLEQISRIRNRSEFFPTMRSHIRLFKLRLKWLDNPLDTMRIIVLSLFLFFSAPAIPVLFFTVGVQGIDQLATQVLPKPKDKQDNNSGADSANQTVTPTASPTPSPASPTQSSAQSTSSPVSSASTPNATPSQSPSSSLVQNQQQGQSSGGASINWGEIIFKGILLFSGGGGAFSGSLALLAKLGTIIGDPKNNLKQYLKAPDYESQVSFIEKFHEDFGKIVKVYAGEGKKVYVFIDDLDRCELAKAGELMQGLNLMISNDPYLIFILGMDREKVAAGIALKQKDVLQFLPAPSSMQNTSGQSSFASSRELEYGYTFIEKFVQLPFQVPQPRADLGKFFDSILEDKQESIPELKQEAIKKPQKKFTIPGLERVSISSPTDDENKGSEERQPTELALPTKLALQSIVDEELDTKKLKEIGEMVAPALDYNPRRLKMFINSFRLKTYIAWNTGNQTKSITLEQLGKFTAISLQWHLLMVALEQDNKLLEKLQKYALTSVSSDQKQSEQDQGAEDSDQKQSEQSGRAGNPEVNAIPLRWRQDEQLKQLLKVGCIDEEGNLTSDYERYSFEGVDIKKLLEVSPEFKGRSKITVSYAQLEQHLKAGRWKEADEETLEVMLKIAKRGAQRYLDIEDIETFPCEDLLEIDRLWVKYSEGKFGFSVQKRIWQECGSPKRYNRDWEKFGDRVGWRRDSNWVAYIDLTFNLEKSLKGELPYFDNLDEEGFWAVVPPLGKLYKGVLFSRAETCRL